MNDERSTIAGLRAQDCPGGGWTGMPAELEGRATVADCLARGVCGCIYGDAVQHIKRLKADRDLWQSRCVGAVWMIPDASTIAELRKATERAAKLIALEQKGDHEGCPKCPDYIGRCPYCGRKRPGPSEFEFTGGHK